MPEAVRVIRREHRSIAAVIHCLESLLRDIRDTGLKVEPAVFETIVDYIQEFPDRFHHPKEDEYLFKAVAKRKPGLRRLIHDLQEQHKEGERKIAEVRDTLDAYVRDEPNAFDAFSEAALGYVSFQRSHLLLEEQKIIPAALDALTPEDWAEIDTAFADNSDPIFDPDEAGRFSGLIKEIVNRAPSPHGVGDRIEENGGRGEKDERGVWRLF